jgi:hypothetical protein
LEFKIYVEACADVFFIYTPVQEECLVLGTMVDNTIKLGFYIP